MDWVPTVAIGLAAALLGGLVARRLGLSPIVGYLVAGIAVGPHTPGFVGDARLAGQIADVGVILLMFGVGLGFSLQDLLAVRRIAVPGALVASTIAVGCGAAVGLAMGFDAGAAAVFGMCFASASTVVIVRGLLELDLLGSAAGRIAVGWSIVEDLIVVLVLVLLPAIAAAGASSQSLPVAIATTFGKVALLALIVIAVGPLVVPRVLTFVARSQSRELFTLAVLVLALGIAFVSSEVFGVSIALGAFLGGMVVGQSDLSHQAAADALPLRDAFAVLFFVAVGMLFDPAFVLDHPLPVLAALLVVLVAKPLAALAVLLWRGYPLRPSLAVGAGLAQVSEFAFVLAGNAVALGVLPEVGRSVVMSSVLVSITASPLLFRGVGPIERWLVRQRPVLRFVARRAGRLAKLPAGETVHGLQGHAVLLGHGRVGTILAGFLRQRGVPFVVIDQDRALVERLRGKGTLALYGDASNPTLLDRARVAAARALLVTTPDSITARLAVEHAHRVNPTIEVVARVHSDAIGATLERFPRTQSVHGEVELAYAMARSMLQKFGVTAIEAEAGVIDARRGTGPLDRGTRLVELHVPADSPMHGVRIADLGMPRGVLVITISRGGEFVVPGGSTELRAGDALLLLADRDSALRFERLLAVGPERPAAAAADATEQGTEPTG